jgi:hypothetical protein
MTPRTMLLTGLTGLVLLSVGAMRIPEPVGLAMLTAVILAIAPERT